MTSIEVVTNLAISNFLVTLASEPQRTTAIEPLSRARISTL